MKILIILLIFCLLDYSLAKSFYVDHVKAEEECFKEQQIKRDDFRDVPITKKKIFMKCLYEKMGYLKDGILQNDKLLEYAKNSDDGKSFKYSFNLCKHIKSSDSNDLAFEINECLTKFDGKYFMQNWETVFKTCNEQVNLPRNEYLTLQYFPVKNITETMKLYAKCAFQRYGFLKDNKLQEDIILELSEDYNDAKHLKEFIKECKDIKEDNENDTAFKLYQCMKEIEDKYIQSIEDEHKMVQKLCLKEHQLKANEVFSKEPPSMPKLVLRVYSNCVFDKLGYIENGIVKLPVIAEKSERAKYANNYNKYTYNCLSPKYNHYEMNIYMVAYNIGLCFDLFIGDYFVEEWKIAGSECEDFEETLNDNEYPKINREKPTLAMKYYAACVFKKLNFLKNNTLQENVISEAMDDYRDPEYLRSFLDKCKQIKENEHGDTAFKLFACMENIIDEYNKNEIS